MSLPFIVWRVVGWDERFETRGTLRQRGPKPKITFSADLNSDEQQRLLDAPGGFIAFGLWNLMCRLAASGDRRGVLLHEGRPVGDADLARLARFPMNLIQPALALLESPEIGLIERVPVEAALVPPELPEPLSRKPKIKPLLQCPVCAADLTQYYQLERVPNEQAQPVTGSVNGANDVALQAGLRDHTLPEGRTTNDTKNDGSDGQECPSYDFKPDATWAETEEVCRRFNRGEMTIDELNLFIETHKFEDDYEEEEADEEEDPRNEFRKFPPPLTREWG